MGQGFEYLYGLLGFARGNLYLASEGVFPSQ